MDKERMKYIHVASWTMTTISYLFPFVSVSMVGKKRILMTIGHVPHTYNGH